MGDLAESPRHRPEAAVRVIRHTGFACVLLAVSAWKVLAADDASTPPTLESVVVTAAPLTATQARAPTGFATEIDPTQHTEQAETVTDALAESVGVQVRRFGGLGAFSTISIRGSSANQVQVYLDGIPLSRARNETVNLADLPLDSLAHIEVYRGTTPVDLGGGGLGGVVNLVTKPPSASPGTELSASYGSFDTRKVTAARTQQLHGIDLLGYVTYLGSDGNFPFLDDHGTPENAADDRRTTRHNNAFNSVESVLKGGYSIANGLRLDMTSETYFKDQGVPGIGNNQSTDASLSDVRSLNYLRFTTTRWPADSVDLSGTLFGEYERQGFRDPHGDLGTGPQNRDDQTAVVGGNLKGTYSLANNAVSSFAELSHEAFDPSNAVPGAPPDPNGRRLHATLAVQDQAGFVSDRFLIVPTVRYEHVHDETAGGTALLAPPATTRDDDLWSPAIGAQAYLLPELALKGNLGRFERPPNFSESFGNSGGLVGNSALRPERAINRDVGFVFTLIPPTIFDALRIEYAYFNNDVSDIIVLIQNSQRVSKPLNISAARIDGHELTLHTAVLHHLNLDMNYTHQDAEDRSARSNGIYLGKQLPGRAPDELYARVELVNNLGKAYYEFNYLSGNFVDEVNFIPVHSRDIHTIGFSLQAFAPLTVSFEARNITDNQVSDIGGFPLPGRSFFGTTTVKF